MVAPARSPWMQPTEPPRRTLAEVLPRQAEPSTSSSSWLRPAPAPLEATPPTVPSPCPDCADVATLRAALATDTTVAEEAGRAEGLRETAALRTRLAAVVAALEQAHAAETRAAVDAIVDVVLAVCAELAPAAAALDPKGVAALMTQVVGAAADQPVTLRVHPDDAALLGAELPTAVRIVADPALASGEIRADGARLVIDATWTTRLAALRDPLVALVRTRGEVPS